MLISPAIISKLPFSWYFQVGEPTWPCLWYSATVRSRAGGIRIRNRTITFDNQQSAVSSARDTCIAILMSMTLAFRKGGAYDVMDDHVYLEACHVDFRSGDISQ